MLLNKITKHKSLIAVSFASMLLVTACGGDEKRPQGQALPVDVFTVITKDVPVSSRLTGRANPRRKAEVRPQVSGIIQSRLFEEGSVVKEGQQLYQIDPALYEAKVESAKAALEASQATLYSARLKADRYRSLLEKKAISKQEYDDAYATFLKAKASVEGDKANLDTAKINLAYTKVYAPIDGIISKSEFTEGALVSAAQAMPLTTIQQVNPIFVDLGQSVEDHLQLRKAMLKGKFQNVDGKATVDIYFSNGSKYEEKGTLEFSGITVEESTGMVSLRAIVPNPDNIILPGMFIRADLNQGFLPKAIVVSQGSVIREANGVSYVYVIDKESKAQRKEIKLGGEYEQYFIVLSGLDEGDQVITSNLQKIRTGAPVMDAAIMQKQAAQNKDAK